MQKLELFNNIIIHLRCIKMCCKDNDENHIKKAIKEFGEFIEGAHIGEIKCRKSRAFVEMLHLMINVIRGKGNYIILYNYVSFLIKMLSPNRCEDPVSADAKDRVEKHERKNVYDEIINDLKLAKNHIVKKREIKAQKVLEEMSNELLKNYSIPKIFRSSMMYDDLIRLKQHVWRNKKIYYNIVRLICRIEDNITYYRY